MPTQVQFRRGSAGQSNNFTGAIGELSINLDTNSIRVHNGITTGGFELARADLSNIGGISTFSVGSLSIGNTEVISSSRTLKNIVALDSITTQTIESAIANAPNTFTDLNVTGITTLGVTSTTYLTAQSINSSGIITASSFVPTSGFIKAPDGTDSFYIYSGTGNVAFQGTIGASQINNSSGYKALDFSSSTTPIVQITNGLVVSGVTTSTSFSGSGANLTSLNASNLSSGTVPSARITASLGDFTVGQNLYVNGSLSVGGTSVILNAVTLQIQDKDILVGYTTDANNNDISNDNTANHGGIAVASTVGSPILNIPLQVGVNSNPPTYKQFMWVKQGNYSGMGTDAWVSNYAISIGNTSTVQDGSRLTVGTGFTVFDTYLDATDIKLRNINVSGISTFTNGPVFIGSGTSTGTASQPLQVTGGGYVSGNFGIGVTNPVSKLDVGGNINASGTVTANSDETLKTNIKQIENSLEKVMSLVGVEYDRIDNQDHQIGLIAQEVEKVVPEVVYPKGDHPEYEKKSIAYPNLIALLIEAIKEQNKRIDELERKLEDL